MSLVKSSIGLSTPAEPSSVTYTKVIILFIYFLDFSFFVCFFLKPFLEL